MNEVKRPKKPLIFYYVIAMVVLFLFNFFAMPWIIGQVADRMGLQAGMFCNLIPCAGILILSSVVSRLNIGKDAE